MLSLYIQGNRVNLPDDFQTEYYIKSPYFTNQGDYTLDIEVNLHDPENARAYAYLHRIDRTKRQLRREAILQDETGVLLRGEEVVLDISEHKANIQIVGGVSELNFQMQDKYLQDLELWHAFNSDEVEYFPVVAHNISDYADHGLVTGDAWDRSDGTAKRRWRIANAVTWPNGSTIPSLSHDIPQPYFWAIVEQVIAALGFEVDDNILRTDERYSKMVMVHAISSPYIADILPRWKVADLFLEIQKFFNVIFKVDHRTRGVSIVNAYDFFSTGGMEVLDKQDIVGEVEKEFDNGDEMTMVSYNAVHYAFTDALLNKYRDIDPLVIDNCDTVSITGDTGIFYQKIWEHEESHPSAQWRIYDQVFAGEHRAFVIWPVGEDYHSVKMVNNFSSKTSKSADSNDVALKIVPVRMVSSPWQGRNQYFWQYPLPAVDGEAASGVMGGTFGGAAVTPSDPYTELNEAIVSGMKKEEETKRADVIFAAFYFGDVPFNIDSEGTITSSTPVASPDYQVQVVSLPEDPAPHGDKCLARQIILSDNPLTMAINGEHGMDTYTYSKNNAVDTSVAYKIRFVTHKRRDVGKVWMIANRLFYCKELKYSLTAGRRSEVVEGIFYPFVNAGTNEGGEAVFYVTYNLSGVIASERIRTVAAGSSLTVGLKRAGGGSASASIQVIVWMGDAMVPNAFTPASDGRSGTVSIASVTGDVHIQAVID